MDDSFENQLPDEPQELADALHEHQDLPDGHLLDRVLRRVRAGSSSPRRWRLLTPRTAVTAILALALVIGARLSHLNPVHTVATLASTITTGTSTSSGGSAADDTYCPEGPGGWAPTFRSHYGAPSSPAAYANANPYGFDDGYSPSVQPNCTDGSLKITWTDQITVPAGPHLWAGYDFHRSAQQLYSVTVSNPKVVLNLKCVSGSPTQPTFSETWGQGYYQNPPQNYWTPDNNNKLDQSGFQSGVFTLPAVCGTGKSVIVTGGTFYATVQAH